MEQHRLKNIIIFILALLNLSLLFSIGTQKLAEHNTHRVAAEQLSALFAADGMALDPSVISSKRPPVGLTVTRDTALEKQIAQQLLGEDVSLVDQGGGISLYTSHAGNIQFRSGGNFDAALSGPIADGERVCTSFCQTFSYSTPQFTLDKSGTGTAVALQKRERLTVYNSSVTFTLEHGAVTQVSGTFVPESTAPSPSEREPLSAIAALIAFQQSRQESGSVVSEITGMDLCWELQSASGNTTLCPVWRISTDTSDFYVNCISGSVRRI